MNTVRTISAAVQRFGASHRKDTGFPQDFLRPRTERAHAVREPHLDGMEIAPTAAQRTL
jgi:hypothetical protein